MQFPESIRVARPFRGVFAVALAGLLISGAAEAAANSRVVDNSDTIVLQNNVHPLARPEFDRGPSPLELPMERMILVLNPRSAARAALDRLLVEQQDPSSPNFHKWLTPAEFGVRFGATDADLSLALGWLQDEGFAVDEIGSGRGWINFSGTVSQVERSFHTQIHDFFVDGEVRHANIVNPSIPRALSGIVRGVVSLHNFPKRAMNTGTRRLNSEGLQPEFTSGTSHYMSPGDFSVIYNVNALYSAGIDGTGQTLAIVARTHPASSNWTKFRSTMGLPSNIPQVVLNGPNPGDLGADEDGEADLDAEWSGGVAKGATVKFVVSKSTGSTDGVDLSAQYIVNNNLAAVMSTSFGQCESTMGSAENTFYNNLWSQAAAQGITSFVSTGDSGAAGCSGGGDTSGTGKAVSGLASTPYNVAVGGTEFNEGSGSYWNTTNAAGDISAKSYIPEMAWNESGSATNCPTGDTCSNLWASSGGASTIYSKPSWQVSPGVPADGKRDIPDVALSAAGHDGYLVETQGSLAAIGGTSASSPSFCGLMTLIVQKTGSRQGNANIRFYQLGQAQYASAGPAVFHDITSGNNTVPGTAGFSCATGYDEVTGLGSVDANALANNWASAATPDFSISAAPTSVSVVQGNPGTSTISTAASGGFNSAVALSATGQPAGVTVAFSPTSIAAPGSGSSTMTMTVATTTATGTYTITVTGSGGASTHTATVSLTVTAAPVPDFSISASPTSVSVVQGNAGTSTMTTAVSGGFNSAVAISASGQPAGVTVAFSPTSIPAPGSGSSTLTMTVASTTSAGTYAITVTGTGGGKSRTAAVTLTVTASGGGGIQILLNPGFENGSSKPAPWVPTAGVIDNSTGEPAHSGSWKAWLDGYGKAHTDTLYQQVAIPSNITTATLTFWLHIDTAETTTSTANDTLNVQIRNSSNAVLATLATYSNLNKNTGYAQKSFNVSAYKGQTIRVYLVGVENGSRQTSFVVDDFALNVQ